MRRASSCTLGMLAMVASACAPSRGTAYDRSLSEARAAVHDGRFDVAAAKFDEASHEAKLPRDAVFMRYEAALALARDGNVARAATELRAIATAKPPSAYAGQAAFEAAELTRASDPAAGRAELETVLVTFPDDGVAQVALTHLLQHDDEDGLEPALAHLDRLLPRVAGKKVEEKVAYERARHIDRLGRTEAARDAYVAVAAKWPYPFGSFNDDSLFRAAMMEEKLGKPDAAIADLERLLSQREVSSFIGSYERPRYLPALLEIARLYEAAGDRGRARSALHRLYTDFTTSTMRDDALWREAALFKKDGDTTNACARLTTLNADFPDSRYVPCAADQCPSIKRSARSKAPRSCHPYLTRTPGEAREARGEALPD